MVWQERSRTIVMLTRLKENNEARRHLALLFPSVLLLAPNFKMSVGVPEMRAVLAPAEGGEDKGGEGRARGGQ